MNKKARRRVREFQQRALTLQEAAGIVEATVGSMRAGRKLREMAAESILEAEYEGDSWKEHEEENERPLGDPPVEFKFCAVCTCKIQRVHGAPYDRWAHLAETRDQRRSIRRAHENANQPMNEMNFGPLTEGEES